MKRKLIVAIFLLATDGVRTGSKPEGNQGRRTESRSKYQRRQSQDLNLLRYTQTQ
jgi:hypothetical protein